MANKNWNDDKGEKEVITLKKLKIKKHGWKECSVKQNKLQHIIALVMFYKDVSNN